MNEQDTFDKLRRVPFEQLRLAKAFMEGPGPHNKEKAKDIIEYIESTWIDDPRQLEMYKQFLEGTGWSKEDLLEELKRRYQ